MIAILEDNQARIDEFKLYFEGEELFITEDPNEFVRFCQKEAQNILLLCLDHDLGYFEHDPYPREITGVDVCKCLIEIDTWKEVYIIIHSANPSGADTMKKILTNAGFRAQRRIFPWW